VIPVPKPRRAGYSYAYELRPVNLGLLPERDAEAVLNSWAGFLNALSSPAQFRIVEHFREAAVGEDVYELRHMRYFLLTAEPIEDALNAAGFGGVRVPPSEVPELRIVANRGRFAVDADGKFVRCYTMLRVPAGTAPGWLTDLYPYVHEVRMELEPLESGRDEVMKRLHFLEAVAEARAREGRPIDPEMQQEMEAVRAAADAIAAGREELFLARVLLAIRADDANALAEASRALRSRLRGAIDSPLFMTEPMCTGRGPEWALGRRLHMTTGALVGFFPFAGLDMIDPTPTAVVLGQNLLTGNAVLYDVYERENYNIAIFGQTGYGKSTLIKAWVSRLAEADPDAYIWVFDSIVSPEYALGPSGRYEGSFAELIGARVLDLSEPQGLNPYDVFETPAAASSFIADLAGIVEPDLRAELNLIQAGDVYELIDKAEGSLKKRLEAGLKPFENLWAARSDLYGRQVFVLSNIASSTVRDAAAYLVLAWIWRTVKKLPVRERKMIVVDEGWAFVETDPRTGKPYFPGAVGFVPEIARTGRHYNAAFIIATQRVSDMMSGPGRVVMESAATKIVLRQDSAAIDLLAGPLSLSPEEQRFILGARVGQGLLISPLGHVPFRNLLSKGELERFTTKPKEVSR